MAVLSRAPLLLAALGGGLALAGLLWHRHRRFEQWLAAQAQAVRQTGGASPNLPQPELQVPEVALPEPVRRFFERACRVEGRRYR